MFYYRDLEAAEKFYGEVLGFEQVLDYGAAKMYQIAATSYITLVRGSKEKHNLGGPNPVTITLVTDELQAWYSYLSQQGVSIKQEEMTAADHLQQSFVALDTEGY